mgnify:CR=1 FL=1
MKILIIEDDKRLAELIKRGLEEDGYVITLAYDGETGKKLALQHDFSLIISDIILPGIKGIEVCRSIRALKPGLPILMLTALGATDDKVEGFDAGADDYLVKPFEFRELRVRVRALIKRAETRRSQIGFTLRYADLEMNTETKTVKRGNTEIKLTPREFGLLEYMLSNPERLLSRNEIAAQVWDTHFDTGTNFVDVYINYLRNKIDKPFDGKMIHTRTGMGFILKKDEP